MESQRWAFRCPEVGRRLEDALRERGIRRLAQSLGDRIVDRMFDRRYGITTTGERNLATLDIDSERRASGNRYKAIPVRHLERCLARLPAAGRTGFVDFGSGLGRTLMVAAMAGFDEVVGVEFAGELVEAAERNCSAFRARADVTTRFRLVNGDAAEFGIEPNHSVFYLYNPFDERVLGEVLSNLERSLLGEARDAWLLYSNPVHDNVIDRRYFVPQWRETWGATDTVSYRWHRR